jgi:hypothetical protein
VPLWRWRRRVLDGPRSKSSPRTVKAWRLRSTWTTRVTSQDSCGAFHSHRPRRGRRERCWHLVSTDVRAPLRALGHALPLAARGRSSVGRASASQAEGRGFDPRRPLRSLSLSPRGSKNQFQKQWADAGFGTHASSDAYRVTHGERPHPYKSALPRTEVALRTSGEVPEQEVGATADGAGAELGVGRAWLDVEFRGRSGRVQRSVERP